MADYVEVLGREFGFRLMTRRELRVAVELCKDDNLAFEEEVCRTCVFKTPPGFPGYDDCEAGIPTELCMRIMEASGYGEDHSFLEREAIQWASTPQARMDVLICFCFPRISLTALEDIDPREYYQYAAASQLIIGGVYGMDAGIFLDPSNDGRPASQRPPGAPPPPPQDRSRSRHLIQ